MMESLCFAKLFYFMKNAASSQQNADFVVKRQVLENHDTARVQGLLHAGLWVVLWDGSS